GLLLTGLGLLVGFIIAVIVGLLQHYFTVVPMPGSFTEAYPLALRWTDFPIVTVVVLFVGLLASILPARRAGRIGAVMREE
ncbi:MAG: ABC transporter permease, partial [Bacteroidota bacterium]